MYGALDISVSGLVAQRTRMATSAVNIANADTILDPEGNVNPFRRRIVHFAQGDPSAHAPGGRAGGVHVASITEDPSPFRLTYDPGNQLAYPEGHPQAGFVPKPNIDPTIEYVNAIEASRAYDANLAVAEATKSMMSQALRLIA